MLGRETNGIIPQYGRTSQHDVHLRKLPPVRQFEQDHLTPWAARSTVKRIKRETRRTPTSARVVRLARCYVDTAVLGEPYLGGDMLNIRPL